MPFYFPYNFYPVTGKIKQGDNVTKPRYQFDYDNKEDKDGQLTTKTLARHDIWQKETYSGNFHVELTTKNLLVVGNKHKKKNPDENDSLTEVFPYKWKDSIALPANSLRGMIASILEVLSQSTLRVLDEKYYPAFKNIGENNNMIPWNHERSKLTPAELLLGVVSESSEEESSKNLASRIRFHDAILDDKCTEPLVKTKVILQQLSSPRAVEKPEINDPNENAYNHYFKSKKTGEHIKQGDVWDEKYENKMKDLLPHGRKFYLSRLPASEYEKNEDETESNKMKCQPIKVDQEFRFDIKFHNLTKAELTLLKISIEPDSSFLHQLGLGKSFGLGMVELKIDESKSNIYSTESTKERYGKKLTAEKNNLSLALCDDFSLIDEDSLGLVKLSSNKEALPPSELIRWRDGFPRGENEKSCPITLISVDSKCLPKAYEEEATTTDKDDTVSDDAKLIMQKFFS